MTAAVHPFKVDRKTFEFEEGVTVKDMIEKAQPDAKQLRHVRVFCAGNVIPREAWSRIKPKSGEIIEVRAFPVPRGGGGGGKDVARIVLTIAVIALAVATGGAAIAALGMTGFAATFTSAVITGVVATVGMMAVNALVPVRAPKLDALSSTAGTSDSPTLFIEGARNSISPFGVVPSVLGKYRCTPPLGSKPYTEIIGDKQFIRMLFVWGIGPLEIDTDSLKIGETPLSEFEGVEIEHREGYATDEPLTLFPDAISQEDFSVILTEALGWVSRTTTVNADEIGIDISFPNGLVTFDDSGNKTSRSVTVEIEYRETGTETWLKVDTTGAKFQKTFADAWMNKSGDDLTSVTFTQNRTSAIRHGLRWGVATRGQYDVRVRRTTADTDDTQIMDSTVWSALRSIKAEDPISAPFPLAVTALVIQATDQLNGVIDSFNGEVTTVCKDWVAGSPQGWVEQATNNPASLFRHVLQGNGINEPLSDDRLDLESLQEWHEFCDEKGFTFNMTRDFASSVWDTLLDVASAGRAVPTQIDGKWGVIIDREQAVPVSLITPRNSFGFKAEKFFLNVPHGWRIRFPNEEQGYSFDERRVYRDGYNDENATRFETLELPGVTNPEQIYRLGRFRIAQAQNQPERWTFQQDMEFLTYKRGDRVQIVHDVMLLGLGYGRVKSLTVDESNAVTSITLDEEVTMEAGKDYGVVIRNATNGNVTAQVTTEAGTTKTLTFVTPVAGVGSPAEAVINVGDLLGFGLLGSESDDATIIGIIPNSKMSATIICVPYRPAIYSADTETIPDFQTKITPLISIPAPAVRSIVSDESAMVISSTGQLRMRVGISFDPADTSLLRGVPRLVVQMRQSSTGEPFYPAVVEDEGPGHVYIGDVRTNETVDIRLRWEVSGRLPGPWTTISGHTVVGRSSAPAPLSNMTISVFGAQALIRWDRPSELDVLFGGEVVFRHSPAMTGASWGESVTIGQSARARTLFAVLPLKEGTYLARVYDVDGNPSDTITAVTTKQASVHEFANVDSLDEAPAFLGDHSDTEESSGSLKLIDGSPNVLEGEYAFAQGIDLTTVSRVRLTTRLAVTIYDVNDNIDDRTANMDSWEDFDGSLNGGADARVFVRHTDDDPSGSGAVWSAWERLDSAEFEARAFQFYVQLTRDSIDNNILVSELGIDVDEVV